MTNLTTMFPHEKLIAYHVACELRRVGASISLKPPGDLAGRTRRVSSRSLAARLAKLQPLSTLRLGRGNATSTMLAWRARSRGGSTRCSPDSSVVSASQTPTARASASAERLRARAPAPRTCSCSGSCSGLAFGFGAKPDRRERAVGELSRRRGLYRRSVGDRPRLHLRAHLRDVHRLSRSGD